jgi:tripartite ATP-independent transporter DctM subunit
MILYATSAGTSVEQLFVAGIIPGLLGAFGLMGMAYYFARRYNLPKEDAFEFRRLWITLVDALPAFTLPVVILGGIFGGFVTATEAAGLAVVAALVVSAWYSKMDFGHLKRAMIDGGVQTAVVMLLVAASVVMGGFLTRAQIPQDFARWILEITTNQWVILAILNVFFLVIGFFLHSAAAIILVVPIVIPLIQAAGIDPIHFGLVVTLNLALGQQTPPVASVLITSCAVARANIWDVSKINIYFIAVLFAVLMLCTYVPSVPMYLVDVIYRS